jgi:hypothetical protein
VSYVRILSVPLPKLVISAAAFRSILSGNILLLAERLGQFKFVFSRGARQ